MAAKSLKSFKIAVKSSKKGSMMHHDSRKICIFAKFFRKRVCMKEDNLVAEKVNEWGESTVDSEYGYSDVGAVVGATYPEMGVKLRALLPKSYILVPGYGAQGGSGKDLKGFFNKDGLGAIVNSSRGIIAAYKNEKYANFGDTGYADASRAAVEDMLKDIRENI